MIFLYTTDRAESQGQCDQIARLFFTSGYLKGSINFIVQSWFKLSPNVGRGGGQVVCVLAFNSDDPSLNPAEAYSFFL